MTGPASPFTVSADTTVTGTYGMQFQLSLATNPAAVGTGNITGASTGDWFNSGAVVSLGATTPVLFNGGNSRYVFTSWSGASGSSNPVSVTMSAPRSVTANYGTEHKLTLATNPAGRRRRESHRRNERQLLRRGNSSQPGRDDARLVQLGWQQVRLRELER